jgi:hypothetical protein
MKKNCLFILSAFLLLGCSTIDDAINDTVNETVSGDVTEETIKAKDIVVVINNVSLAGCALLKQSIALDDRYENVDTLVTQIGVTCATYGKTAGVPEETGTVCTEEDIAEWLARADYTAMPELDDVEGDKACVIGADL